MSTDLLWIWRWTEMFKIPQHQERISTPSTPAQCIIQCNIIEPYLLNYMQNLYGYQILPSEGRQQAWNSREIGHVIKVVCILLLFLVFLIPVASFPPEREAVHCYPVHDSHKMLIGSVFLRVQYLAHSGKFRNCCQLKTCMWVTDAPATWIQILIQ